jgi:ParB family chromosome partitioning protein
MLVVLSTSVVSFGVIEDTPISEIRLPTNQIRSHIELEELSLSIAKKGLLQPIIVRTVDNKTFYEIVAGCRRYLACKKLGMRKITCQITHLDEKEAFEVSIMENIQRKTISVMDEAIAFKAYVLDYGWGGVSELADKLGKSISYITKRIMLLDLPKDIKDSIARCTLSPSVAQELVYLQNDKDRSNLAKLIINRRPTVKSVRKMVKEFNDGTIGDATIAKETTNENRQIKRSFDRTIITLRIAMNRICIIINEAEDNWILHEMLMQHKRRLHEQIDILIKQRKKMA